MKKVTSFSSKADAEYVISNDYLYSEEEVNAAKEYLEIFN